MFSFFSDSIIYLLFKIPSNKTNSPPRRDDETVFLLYLCNTLNSLINKYMETKSNDNTKDLITSSINFIISIISFFKGRKK